MPRNTYHIWFHPRQSAKLGRFHSTGTDKIKSNPTILVEIVTVFALLGRSTPFPNATNMNEDHWHLTIIEPWPKCYPFSMSQAKSIANLLFILS